MMAAVRLILSLVVALQSLTTAFYLPGVAPRSYVEGEDVDLKVNKLRYFLPQ